MTRLGIFVGEQGNWSFFDHIYSRLKNKYETVVFKERKFTTPLLYGRLNRWVHREGIRSILRNCDVNFFEWASQLLVIASNMPKYSPIITRLHSFEIYTWAPKVNWENVDLVILVSKAMQKKFNDMYPDHANKTRVINNGVRLDQFIPPDNRQFQLNIGMLGRITPIKRVYETVLMLHNLRGSLKPHLHIGGEPMQGPEVSEYSFAINRLIDSLELREHITFDGYINNVPEWYKNIDIYISNSFWEGQQVTLLEAMASGCYCLSHYWDGSEEILPAENLFITENGLVEKIKNYSVLPDDKKQKLQYDLRKIACDKFDIENTIRQIDEVVMELSNHNL